jgi:hypothetical protein
MNAATSYNKFLEVCKETGPIYFIDLVKDSKLTETVRALAWIAYQQTIEDNKTFSSILDVIRDQFEELAKIEHDVCIEYLKNLNQ